MKKWYLNPHLASFRMDNGERRGGGGHSGGGDGDGEFALRSLLRRLLGSLLSKQLVPELLHLLPHLRALRLLLRQRRPGALQAPVGLRQLQLADAAGAARSGVAPELHLDTLGAVGVLQRVVGVLGKFIKK